MRFFVDGSIKTPITEYLTNPKYQQVEYLESTGTQYIDTGLKGKNNIDFDYRCVFTNLDGTAQCVGGNWSGADTSSVSFYLGLIRVNGSFGYHYDGTNSPVVIMNRTVQDTPYSVQGHMWTGEQYMVINGTKTSVGTISSAFTSSLNMYLFGINNNGLSNPAYMKLYYCKIYDNGILVRNFIPVIRKEDDKPGMYDKVSEQFFTNAGTGEFLYGNPVYNGVPKGYKECEYIESTGTQWIDPGVIPTSNMEFYTKIRFNSDKDLNNDVAVIGVRSGMIRLQPIHAYQNKWAIGIGDDYHAYGSPLAVDTDYNIRSIVSDGKTAHLYVNDVLSSSITNTNGIPSSPLYFMTRNLNGAPNPITKMRANFLKIYSEGSLVRDYVPVLREADNEPGMYDRVSNTFFANKGTGTFIYKLKERQTEKVTRILYSGSKMRLVRNPTA